MTRAFERTLDAWAAEFRAALPQELREAYGRARAELYWGPRAEFGEPDDEDPDTYPGFAETLSRLRDISPAELWIDTDAELAFTDRPRPVECFRCGGSGCVAIGYEDEEDEECPACGGSGKEEPDLEFVYEVDSREIRAALWGELAEYI